MIDRVELRELRKLIEEARIIFSTTHLPTDRSRYARDLVESAVKQADSMLARPTAWMLAQKGRAKISIKR
ncbi:MAG TPA: hypothetical protein VKF41_09755 [Bryobacteraceae bacterium]|nr:hypothetical protein [Bryobacteraceae bacterium]